MSGKRPVQSWPFRVNNRNAVAVPLDDQSIASCLISWSQAFSKGPRWRGSVGRVQTYSRRSACFRLRRTPSLDLIEPAVRLKAAEIDTAERPVCSANVAEAGVQQSEKEGAVPEGQVVAVSSDGKHRFSKTTRLSIMLTVGHGIEGDAHYGPFVRHRYLARRNPKAPNLRQVHLIPSELFDSLRSVEFKVHAGELGENVTTAGLDLERLPLGTVLRLGGSAALELTGLRTPCILIDRFEAGLKSRLLSGSGGPRFKAGVMAIVTEGGMVDRSGPMVADGPSSLVNSRRAAASGSSFAPISPFGIDNAPSSLLRQKGPPGCTSRTRMPFTVRR